MTLSRMLSVEEALERILASVSQPTKSEMISLKRANGRVLASDIIALRDQPPFRASAMDGYAVLASDVATAPVTLKIIGTSAAGHGFAGAIEPGQTARIFTGAPLPSGSDTVVIQENTLRSDACVTILEAARPGSFVRPAGLDFTEGASVLPAGHRLRARDIGLCAALGHASLPIRTRPLVGVLATGDELVRPGCPARDDQIVLSNTYALMAFIDENGGEALDLGIARDTPEALDVSLTEALARDVDVLVTTGGASVGDHDLVQSALITRGMDIGFWTIAMRPGKPLMHATLQRLDRAPLIVLGLPGNPVSSYVCALLFLGPLLRKLVAQVDASRLPLRAARLSAPIKANDVRQDYLRARVTTALDGTLIAHPFETQDSSMTKLLSDADGLIVRPPNAPAAQAGDDCAIVMLS